MKMLRLIQLLLYRNAYHYRQVFSFKLITISHLGVTVASAGFTTGILQYSSSVLANELLFGPVAI